MSDVRKKPRRGPKRLWVRWLILFACGYLALCVVIYVLQRSIQYLPNANPVPIPSGPKFTGLEEVQLRTRDGLRLFAWYWPGKRAETLLIFHGNAGHRNDRLQWMRQLHERGWSVFLLDYRGYGGSEGSPSESGFYQDADAAIAWLQRRSDAPLIYLGESIGSGVAVDAAIRHPPAALIVQAGFSSATDVAATVYPFLPVSLLLEDKYESFSKIGELSCPYLHVHGEADRVIPVDLGRKLFGAAPQPKRFVSYEGFGHNDLLWVGSRYYDAIDSFLLEHVIGAERSGEER